MQILDKQQKLQWLGYVFIPFITILKLLVVTIILSTGEVFYNLKLSFEKAFKVVLYSEAIFVIMEIIKLLWVYLFVNNLSIEYLQFFTPLSLINIFNLGELEPWFIYPFQTLNIFELIYIYLLTFNINKITDCGMGKATNLVLSTYGIGLIIWIVFVSFITLNFTM